MRSVRKEMREIKRELVEIEALKAARFNSLAGGPRMPGCRSQWGVGPWPFQVSAYVTFRLVDTGRRDEMEREMGLDLASERDLEVEYAVAARLMTGGRDFFLYPEAERELEKLFGHRLRPYDDAVRERDLLARWNARYFDIRRRADVWSAGRRAASYEVVDAVWGPPDGVPRPGWGCGMVSHTESPISREDWLWLGVPNAEMFRGSIPLPSWAGVAEAMSEEDRERERWYLEVAERLEQRGDDRRFERRIREDQREGTGAWSM